MHSYSDCWTNEDHAQIYSYASRNLWRYIQRNARTNVIADSETVMNLTSLSPDDIRTLADIQFLLSKSVSLLIDEIAPKIINRLSKASVSERITSRPPIKGTIDWHKTFLARATEGNDRSVFVYARRSQIFDLPENRLFLYVLRHIYEAAKRITPDDFRSLTWYAEAPACGKWIDRITAIAAHSLRFLRNPYIARIGALHELSERLIEAVGRSREPYYRELADIAKNLLANQNSPVRYLHHHLKGNILEPLNKDDLFEVAVLFKIIETAKLCGWTETRTKLIGSSSRTACTLKKNAHVLNIYYQKLPARLSDRSRYKDLLKAHGFPDSLRRPDIILSLEGPLRKMHCIIEVKRSESKRYLFDGVYKLLGYLKDFELIRDKSNDLIGFLVGWKGLPAIQFEAGREVSLSSWADMNIAFMEMFMVGLR